MLIRILKALLFKKELFISKYAIIKLNIMITDNKKVDFYYFNNKYLFKNMNSSYSSPTTKTIYKGSQVVWYILGVIQLLLAFRFVFRLMGANPEAGFTNFIYSITRPLTAPFSAVFPSAPIEANFLEWSTLLAMLVYWIIALGVVKLFFLSRSVSTPEAARKLEEEEKDL